MVSIVTMIVTALSTAGFAYVNFFNKSQILAVVFKTTASLSFCLTAFFSYRYAQKKRNFKGWTTYTKYLMTAFIFSLLGDVLLQLDYIGKFCFFMGFITFSCAQISYIIAFMQKTKIQLYNVIVAAAILIVFIILSKLLNIFDFTDFYSIIIVYGILVCFNFGKSLSLLQFRKTNPVFSYFTVSGAFLFLVADFLMLAIWFIPAASLKFFGTLQIIVYYVSQTLLALGLMGEEKENIPDDEEENLSAL